MLELLLTAKEADTVMAALYARSDRLESQRKVAARGALNDDLAECATIIRKIRGAKSAAALREVSGIHKALRLE